MRREKEKGNACSWRVSRRDFWTRRIRTSLGTGREIKKADRLSDPPHTYGNTGNDNVLLLTLLRCCAART